MSNGLPLSQMIEDGRSRVDRAVGIEYVMVSTYPDLVVLGRPRVRMCRETATAMTSSSQRTKAASTINRAVSPIPAQRRRSVTALDLGHMALSLR